MTEQKTEVQLERNFALPERNFAQPGAILKSVPFHFGLVVNFNPPTGPKSTFRSFLPKTPNSGGSGVEM